MGLRGLIEDWFLTQRGPLTPKGGIGLSGFIVGFGFLRREAYYSLQLCHSEVRGISALGSDFDEKYFVFWGLIEDWFLTQGSLLRWDDNFWGGCFWNGGLGTYAGVPPLSG